MNALLWMAANLLVGSAEPVTLSRYALVIGADQGALRDVRLHQAGADAARLATALETLGGFASGHVRLLLQPSSNAVRSALDALQPQMAADHAEHSQTFLLIYFAGHAEPAAMHLGQTLLSFQDVLQLSGRSGADERVLVVDASRAEASPKAALSLRRAGIGLPRVARAAAAQSTAPGLSLFTAMSADPAARESAAAGGALTRHLLAALAGAADANRDEQISLRELLQYSVDRTLRLTDGALSAQPRGVFQYHLGSTGAAILASVPQLEIQPRMHLVAPGTYSIRRADRRHAPALEVTIAQGERAIALPAGTYLIERRDGGRVRANTVALQAATVVRVDEDSLRPLVANAGDGA